MPNSGVANRNSIDNQYSLYCFGSFWLKIIWTYSLTTFFYQSQDVIRDIAVTGVQTLPVPISKKKKSKIKNGFLVKIVLEYKKLIFYGP